MKKKNFNCPFISFIILNRNIPEWLLKDHDAFVLLTYIALHSKRSYSNSFYNKVYTALEPNEAIIGCEVVEKNLGITRSKFRKRLNRLEISNQIVVVETTNKFTKVRLLESCIFYINAEKQPSKDLQKNNREVTSVKQEGTNNNVNNIKNVDNDKNDKKHQDQKYKALHLMLNKKYQTSSFLIDPQLEEAKKDKLYLESLLQYVKVEAQKYASFEEESEINIMNFLDQLTLDDLVSFIDDIKGSQNRIEINDLSYALTEKVFEHLVSL